MKRKKPLEFLQVLTYVTIFSIMISALLIIHFRLRYCSIFDAIRMNDLKAINKCILMGADINARDDSEASPLLLAFRYGRENAAIILIHKGADVKIKEKDSTTPLHYATQFNNDKVAAMLLEKGADINAQTDKKRTPLHYALYSAHFSTARLLIDKGADVKATDRAGRTPLHYIAWLNNNEMASKLIELGVDVNARDIFGLTPLHIAAGNHHENGRYPSVYGYSRIIPADLEFSLPKHWNRNTEIREILIKSGANRRIKYSESWHPLEGTAYSQSNISALLISKGADVNSKDITGSTPLFYAANGEIAELLISKGADVNVRNILRQTSLHMADNKGVAEVFIKRGAEVNFTDMEGRAPLHFAVDHCYRNIVEILISSGADVKAHDRKGRTPLHHAVITGNRDLSGLLMKNGADVNTRDKDGNTPMLSLLKKINGRPPVAKENIKLIELLISSSANANLPDNRGFTAHHYPWFRDFPRNLGTMHSRPELDNCVFID